MFTFAIPQLKSREIIAENLGICVVALTIATATAHITTASGPSLRGSLSLILGRFLVQIISINSLLQVCYPRVNLALCLQEALAEVLADHR